MSNRSIKNFASVSTLRCATIAMAGFLTVAIAHAQTPAPATAPATPSPAYGKLVVTGLIDGYYQYAFDKAKSATSVVPGATTATGNIAPTATGAGALYTTKQATPSLSLAEANLTILPAPGGFGAKATLGVGDTADGNVSTIGAPATGTGSENRYKNIMQLYGSYALAGSGGGEVDLGKFYTPFGYEVTESNANFNYSRSTTYQLLPAYHTGIRVTSPTFAKAFTVSAYVVEALYNTAYEGVSNKSGSPAGIGQITFTDPNGKFTFVETIGGGTNKVNDTDAKGLLSDTDFTLNMTSSDTLGLNYTYENEKVSGAPTTIANGYGVYYKKQLNPKDAIALRYSGYQSTAGAGNGNTSATFKPYDITATYEIKTSTQWLTRFEYRYDAANTPIYADSNGNYTDESQSTLIASEVFTF